MTDKIIWDQTNIGENYPGITSPLTYSFIKDAYTEVYTNFLKRLGVRTAKIESKKFILNNMLGYVQGRVYYNIENWYEFLKYLPSYKYNKKFFETMLDPVLKKGEEKDAAGLNFVESAIIAFNYVKSLIFFNLLHDQFEREFNIIFQGYQKQKLRELDNFKLILLFETIQKKFFSLWSITIINDFKVMIFYGILKTIADHKPQDANEILKDIYSLKKQPRSVLPLKDIISLAAIIREDINYSKLFQNDARHILATLQKPQFNQLAGLIQNYLKEYGERTSNELKLEEPKFKDHPASFINLVKYYVHLSETDAANLQSHMQSKKTNSIPESYSPIDRFVLKIIKPIAVRGIYLREYYRLKRGKTFNIAREIFLEIGRRLQQAGDLNAANDIFYLYRYEIFNYVEHHTLKSNFRQIVAERKKLLADHENEKLPRRIMSIGFPNKQEIKSQTQARMSVLQGQATSRGRVEGKVIVMKNLDLTTDYKGKILVTTATDPGWTIIFPLLKGIITEQGGALSHASIIAREFGIPCIVKVNDAAIILKTGDQILLDANLGKVRILDQ